MAVQPRKKTKL